jgi:glycosyltransferase involved in cell wall biosynthesis
MKVLIANTLYYPEIVGGAEISTQILAEGLAACGVDVLVVCATGTGVDRVERINGVTVHYLRLANVYWPHAARKPSRVMRAIWHTLDVHNVLMTRKLEKIILRERPDVVSTSNLSCLSTGIWRLAAEAGARIVHTTRDYYLICPTVRMFSDNKSCERQCRICAVYAQPKKTESARVDMVIGVSRFVLKRHLELGFFPRAASAVIGDCYMPAASREAREVWVGGLSDTTASSQMRIGGVRAVSTGTPPVHLGILGRISQEKGIELVLEQLLKAPGLNWRLSIGGTGNPAYVDGLKARYGNARIDFQGYVDPRVFFSGIDILLVPSKWQEPFGRVTVEAYAHGIPVVGAQCGGIPEVIEPNSALLFDPQRPETLLERIAAAQRLLRDPNFRPMLLERASLFSPARMIEAYLGVYLQVLGSGVGNLASLGAARRGVRDAPPAEHEPPSPGKITPVA